MVAHMGGASCLALHLGLFLLGLDKPCAGSGGCEISGPACVWVVSVASHQRNRLLTEVFQS
jgi:hypothetical protein